MLKGKYKVANAMFDIKPVDNSGNVDVSKIANDAGLKTIVAFFNDATAKEIRKEYGAPDMIVASSIFTHLENPHDFIDAVKILMAPTGQFVIEVEYIGNILKNVQFERFYLDRIFYYSLSSLCNLFEAHGMKIVDVEEITPHGGSIRVIARNKKGAGAVKESVKSFLKQEEKNLTLPKLKEFKKTVDSAVTAFSKKLEGYKKSKLKVAGYGAPARVATITNYGKIGPSLISFIIDDSPLKQNRFSPGMHIPISPASRLEKERPDILVVFAYEYFDDIKKKTGGKYRYLIPIPPREVR